MTEAQIRADERRRLASEVTARAWTAKQAGQIAKAAHWRDFAQWLRRYQPPEPAAPSWPDLP